MNRRQKNLLRDLLAVVAITTIAVVAMIIFRDWINRSEDRRAMERLGQVVLQYRKNYGALPPKTYVDKIREDLKGYVRLGELQYRALWIDSGSMADEILAYTEKKSHSLLVDDGYLVLRLDGRVEWMSKKEFEMLLAQQQSPEEIQILRQ